MLAPLVAPVIIIARSFTSHAYLETQGLVAVLAVSSVVAYASTLLFAFPLVFVLRKLHRLSVVALSACGALLGMIVMLAISSGPVQALWGGVLGLLVSCAFGLIAGVPNSTSEA